MGKNMKKKTDAKINVDKRFYLFFLLFFVFCFHKSQVYLKDLKFQITRWERQFFQNSSYLLLTFKYKELQNL